MTAVEISNVNAPANILRPPPASDLDLIEGYALPTAKLKREGLSPGREPVVLLLCGAFSPPTFAHLRMFVLAADEARLSDTIDLVGAYISPVGDGYSKAGLVAAKHRVAMAELAVQDSAVVMVDPWESRHAHGYVPTHRVLAHLDREVNERHGGVVDAATGQQRRVRVSLLAGLDLIATMHPPLWLDEELEAIMRHGIWVVERAGAAQAGGDITALKARWGDSALRLLRQPVPNEVSSTRVRALIAHGCSVQYLVPDAVIAYIYEHGLYGPAPA